MKLAKYATVKIMDLAKKPSYNRHMTWTNNDNGAFYENSADTLQAWSSLGGLDSCPDLLAIQNYLDTADTILEIGAGFGRVIKFLKNCYPNKKITAIERSTKLYDLLKLQSTPNTELILSDITHFQSNKSFDLILWLWSGLTDFSQKEQLNIIRHITLFMKKEARFIIETFPHDAVPANGQVTATQHYILNANNKDLHGYIPSPHEMQNYADALNFVIEKTIYYTTSSDRKRIMYVLKDGNCSGALI